MAKTAAGTAHRHKDSRGKWVTDELPHTHDVTIPQHPADALTAAEVAALKLILATGGNGGTTPEPPNPPIPPTPDIIAPTVSNVAIPSGSITTSGAVVTCNTDEAATVVVEYGLTIAYGSQTGASSSGTAHSRTLSGLTSNTTYHIRVRATDTAGNVRTDSDRIFTTLAVTPPTSNPSGEAMPTGSVVSGGSTWNMVFSDDFTTPVAEGQFPQAIPAVAAKWSCYPADWHDTSGNGFYGGQIVSFHDSQMDMYCRNISGVWRVAAPIPQVGWPKTNCRISVRFKADSVAGFKTAWLLWPQSNVWPRDGEIDFPEGNLQSTIEAYMHRQGATVGSDQDFRGTSEVFTSWHTAVMEWEAGVRCAFYLDGTLLGSAITSRVPNTPMRYVMQTETRLSGGPPPGGAAAHVYVDWIAIWVKA